MYLCIYKMFLVVIVCLGWAYYVVNWFVAYFGWLCGFLHLFSVVVLVAVYMFGAVLLGLLLAGFDDDFVFA